MCSWVRSIDRIWPRASIEWVDGRKRAPLIVWLEIMLSFFIVSIHIDGRDLLTILMSWSCLIKTAVKKKGLLAKILDVTVGSVSSRLFLLISIVYFSSQKVNSTAIVSSYFKIIFLIFVLAVESYRRYSLWQSVRDTLVVQIGSLIASVILLPASPSARRRGENKENSLHAI